jgi:hypothetical protein
MSLQSYVQVGMVTGLPAKQGIDAPAAVDPDENADAFKSQI